MLKKSSGEILVLNCEFLFQSKKNSPLHIKRPLNAFMVFSHYERRRVLADSPDIQNNILLSKELGR